MRKIKRRHTVIVLLTIAKSTTLFCSNIDLYKKNNIGQQELKGKNLLKYKFTFDNHM